MKLNFLRALAAAFALFVCAAPCIAAGPIVYQDVTISVHNNNDHGVALTASIYSMGRHQQVGLPPRKWTDIKLTTCCGHQISFDLKTRGKTARYVLEDYKSHVKLWVDTRNANAHPDIPSAQDVKVKFYGNVTEH